MKQEKSSVLGTEKFVKTVNFNKGWIHWVPAFLSSYFWILGVAMLTHLLAPVGITLFVPGVLVVVPALLMPMRRGLTSVILSGFLFDASIPVPFGHVEGLSFFLLKYNVSFFGEISAHVPAFFGFVTGWMIFAYLILRLVRARLDLPSPMQWIVCAAIVNSIIFIFWGIAMGWQQIGTLVYWAGFLVNFLASTTLLFVCGWWYFDLIVSAYRIVGVDIVAEREAQCE